MGGGEKGEGRGVRRSLERRGAGKEIKKSSVNEIFFPVFLDG